MIFANYGCGGYDILNHARWNGLHLADVVFPWFMWIMGVCIPISLSSSFKKNVVNYDLVKKILIVSTNTIKVAYKKNKCILKICFQPYLTNIVFFNFSALN